MTVRSEYVTQKRASQTCKYPMASMPEMIATITCKGCIHALNFHGAKSEIGVRYIPDTSNVKYDSGKTYAVGPRGEKEIIDSDTIDDYTGWDGFENVDTIVMHMLLTILLNYDRKRYEAEGYVAKAVAVYVPDLLKACGVQNVGQAKRTIFMDKCRALEHVFGVFPDSDMVLPFLQNCDVMDDQGILLLDSPYLNYLLRHMYFCRAKEAAKWKKPYVSIVETHMKATIYKERNRNAAEVVRFICTEIARIGYSEGRVKVSTIVRNTNVLYHQVEECENIKYKTRYYTRAFKKAWELISSQTTLPDDYPHLTIPSPDDEDSVPTYAERDRVFEIHRGLVRKRKKKAKKTTQINTADIIMFPLYKSDDNDRALAAEDNTCQHDDATAFVESLPELPVKNAEDFAALYKQENERRKEQGLLSLEDAAAKREEYDTDEAIAAMCAEDPELEPADLKPTAFSAFVVDSDDPRYYDFPFESSGWEASNW